MLFLIGCPGHAFGGGAVGALGEGESADEFNKFYAATLLNSPNNDLEVFA